MSSTEHQLSTQCVGGATGGDCWRCRCCDVTVHSQSALADHWLRRHQRHVLVGEVRSSRRCPVCCQRLTSLLTVTAHVQSHRGDFRCAHCSMVFSNSSAIARHRCYHSTLQPTNRQTAHPSTPTSASLPASSSVLASMLFSPSEADPPKCDVGGGGYRVARAANSRLKHSGHAVPQVGQVSTESDSQVTGPSSSRDLTQTVVRSRAKHLQPPGSSCAVLPSTVDVLRSAVESTLTDNCAISPSHTDTEPPAPSSVQHCQLWRDKPCYTVCSNSIGSVVTVGTRDDAVRRASVSRTPQCLMGTVYRDTVTPKRVSDEMRVVAEQASPSRSLAITSVSVAPGADPLAALLFPSPVPIVPASPAPQTMSSMPSTGSPVVWPTFSGHSPSLSASGTTSGIVSASQQSLVSASQQSLVSASKDALVSASQQSLVSASQQSLVSASQQSLVSASKDALVSASSDPLVSILSHIGVSTLSAPNIFTPTAVQPMAVSDGTVAKTTASLLPSNVENTAETENDKFGDVMRRCLDVCSLEGARSVEKVDTEYRSDIMDQPSAGEITDTPVTRSSGNNIGACMSSFVTVAASSVTQSSPAPITLQSTAVLCPDNSVAPPHSEISSLSPTVVGTPYCRSSCGSAEAGGAARRDGTVCEVCGGRFASASSLRNHQLLHSSPGFRCHLCHRTFARKDTLLNHLSSHTVAQIQCSLCARRLKTAKSLAVHMKLHSGDARFSCHLCERAFIQKASLQRHLSTVHPTCATAAAAGGHSCGRCSRHFATGRQLKLHTCRSQQRSVFPCWLCGSSFPSRHQLRRHARAVHSRLCHVCSYCGARIRVRSNMIRHLSRAHDDKRSEWQRVGYIDSLLAVTSQHSPASTNHQLASDTLVFALPSDGKYENQPAKDVAPLSSDQSQVLLYLMTVPS